MRRHALLSGVATAMLFAAPALAQDATQSQGQSQDAQSPTPASPRASSQGQTQSGNAVQVSPGMTVTGGDGVLGTLVGVQTSASGQQELTVKGEDGQVRTVPLTGFKTENGGITVAATRAEYAASTVVPGSTTPEDGEARERNPNAATPAAPATPANRDDGDSEDEDDSEDDAETRNPGAATPATPAVPANRAPTQGTAGEGERRNPNAATPAVPAVPAVPADRDGAGATSGGSHANHGQGGEKKKPN